MRTYQIHCACGDTYGKFPTLEAAIDFADQVQEFAALIPVFDKNGNDIPYNPNQHTYQVFFTTLPSLIENVEVEEEIQDNEIETVEDYEEDINTSLLFLPKVCVPIVFG